VAQDIGITVAGCDLEVAVIGREPPVENFQNFETPLAEREGARFLVAAEARVTFNLEFHCRLASAR